MIWHTHIFFIQTISSTYIGTMIVNSQHSNHSILPRWYMRNTKDTHVVDMYMPKINGYNVHRRMHACTQIETHLVCVSEYILSHTVHIHMHACINACMHVCKHTYRHPSIYAHTRSCARAETSNQMLVRSKSMDITCIGVCMHAHK